MNNDKFMLEYWSVGYNLPLADQLPTVGRLMVTVTSVGDVRDMFEKYQDNVVKVNLHTITF